MILNTQYELGETLLTGIDTEVMLVSVAYTARQVSFVLGGHRCADHETMKKKCQPLHP